ATARKLNIAADPSRPPTELGTANGTISARFGLADELRLGAINARKVTVIIIPDTNRPVAVIGMDLLSRLEGWRVENDKLILSPPRQ
ncbi:MAG: retroviral-like aspartic protease family protein, partial [Sphingomonadales bacterium]|nr:retroviral-like aspartic protease family protein [Sphingomonadaceae bacterium]MBS3931653.1 retroviral-like aspartic protease family protein [Sphingomonadales bacterium]